MSSSSEFSSSYEQSQPELEQVRVDLLRDIDRKSLQAVIDAAELFEEDEPAEEDEKDEQTDGLSKRISVEALISIDRAMGTSSTQVYDVAVSAVMHRQLEESVTGQLVIGEAEMFVDEPFNYRGAHEDETVDITYTVGGGAIVDERPPSVIFLFSKETDDGEEFYQAKFESIATLDKITEMPDDWAEVVREIDARSKTELQTKAFLDASVQSRQATLDALCRDAEEDLEILIHHKTPVDIETSHMYIATAEGLGTYTADLVRSEGVGDSLVGFGIIKRVVYLEQGEFENLGFPRVDDLAYGNGTPFLFVEGADDDDTSLVFIPIESIESIKEMDTKSDESEDL